MASLIYPTAKKKLADGTFDLDSHTFKIALLGAYTYNAAHALWSNVSGSEITGTNYVAGGQALTSVTWLESGGTVTFDAADPVWASATFSASYAVIYDDSAPGKDVLCLLDFGGSKSVSNGSFTVQFNASGIFTLS